MTPNRRQALAGLAAMLAMPALAELRYILKPQAVADGLWVLRGDDGGIAMANGGAIANIAIIATGVGAVLVDAGPSHRYGAALAATARRLVKGPVARLYLTHLHPDHGFGSSAFAPAITAATPDTAAQVTGDAAGFSAGMYRLLGDWMRGTEVPAPGLVAAPGPVEIGGRRLRLLSLAGHSASDLAVLDEATGTLIAGDLVFHDRAPATPHADLARWRASLDTLAALGHARVIPGHGPVDASPHTAIAQTRDWLDWLETALADALRSGLDMVAAGQMPIPDRFAPLVGARVELQRSVAHFYPGLEKALLPRVN